MKPLLIVAGSLLVLVGFVVGILFMVASIMKSTDVYTHAVEVARSSDAVQTMLGAPIEEGFIPSGEINTQNDSGDANLVVTLTGPAGEAELYIVAHKARGEWSYEQLDLVFEAQRVDLRSTP